MDGDGLIREDAVIGSVAEASPPRIDLHLSKHPTWRPVSETFSHTSHSLSYVALGLQINVTINAIAIKIFKSRLIVDFSESFLSAKPRSPSS